jgi:hypothetical protein
MVELKASTKKGQEIIARGSQYEGTMLSQVYDNWSSRKENAFDWCFAQYVATENRTAFSICSHNTFMFTCSWLGTKDGENIMRYETPSNSYLVWLDR